MIVPEFFLFYLGGAFITGFFITLVITWGSEGLEEADPDKLLPLILIWPFTVIVMIVLVTVEAINSFRRNS